MAGSEVTPQGFSGDELARRLEHMETRISELQSSVPQSVYDIATQITAGLPIGTCVPNASIVVPIGWLLADGSAVSRTTYSDLFDAIGTTYGAGNGSTTFNLPAINGRVVVGVNAADSEFNVPNIKAGEKYVTLTESELASHAHSQPAHAHSFSGSDSHTHGYTDAALDNLSSGGLGAFVQAGGDKSKTSYSRTTNSATVTIAGTTGSSAPNTNAAGGNAPHNNLQPYISMPYIIKHNRF